VLGSLEPTLLLATLLIEFKSSSSSLPDLTLRKPLLAVLLANLLGCEESASLVDLNHFGAPDG
jgi:hypothetical protein